MRRIGSAFLVAFAACVGWGAATASAQVICVPQAGGVPYNRNPPSWWAPGDASVGADDARWRGAVALGAQTTLDSRHGGGTLRVLQREEAGTTHLYLSFTVIDPEGNDSTTDDRVQLVLASEDGSVLYRLTVGVNTQDAMQTPDAADVSVAMQEWNGLEWVSVDPIPGWAESVTAAQVAGSADGGSPADGRVRAYVSCNAGDCATGATWTLQLRVPIGAADASDLSSGLPIGNDFHLWFRTEATYFNGFEDVPLENYWPAGVSSPPTDVGSMQAMHVGTSGTCRTGITLQASQIRVNGGLEIPSNPTFRARPENLMSMSLRGDAIRARFRIADWGSNPSEGGDWTEVCSGSGDSAATVDGTDADGGPQQFDLSCTDADFDICNYQSGQDEVPSGCPADAASTSEHRPHQCILAELSLQEAGPEDTEVLFTPASVYRNMDVETASTVRRKAVVSLDGLGDLAGEPDREVYLYVETHNMPLEDELGPDDQLPPTKWDPKLRRLMETGQASYAEVADRMPTYLVHVLHEEREPDAEGSERKVFRMQPSFGFFVSHDSTFDHWLHRIEGDAVEKVRDHLYRLEIENGGKELVTVHVQTCVGDECDEVCPGCPCPEGGDCACEPPECECEGPDCPNGDVCPDCPCPEGGDCACEPPKCQCEGPDCPHCGCPEGDIGCLLRCYWWAVLLGLVALVVIIIFIRRRSP